MFDNPKKELQRLEKKLLEADMSDEEFEEFYSEIYDEFGPGDEDLTKDLPVRNYSNNYGRPAKPAPKKPQPNTYTDSSRAMAPVKKEKGIRGLVILICFEIFGIAAVALWWILRLL